MSETDENRPKGLAEDLTPTRRRFLRDASTVALSAAVLAEAGTLLLPRDASAEAGKVRLGVLLPLSGQFALSGQNIRRGYDFAIEEINKAGGIKSLAGAMIELVY